MKTKSKDQYEAPAISVVELNSAGGICQSSPQGVYDPDNYGNGGDPLAGE